MKVRIGTVDGRIHESKDFTINELQDYIEENNGEVFTGAWEDRNTDDAQEVLDEMMEMLKYDKKNNTQYFNMEQSNGVSRNFNVCHIVWWELDERDD